MTEDEHEQSALNDLLRSLDHEPPRITLDDVIARAQRRRGNTMRIAASIVFAIAFAGVAYALPGSPLRAWLHARVLQSNTTADRREQPRPAAEIGGMVFEPAEPLTVVFASPVDGQLRISFRDDQFTTAALPGGNAQFTSEPNRLIVRLLAADTFDLHIARSAQQVEVYAGERRIFQLQNGRILSAQPALSDGSYQLPLSSQR